MAVKKTTEKKPAVKKAGKEITEKGSACNKKKQQRRTGKSIGQVF